MDFTITKLKRMHTKNRLITLKVHAKSTKIITNQILYITHL